MGRIVVMLSTYPCFIDGSNGRNLMLVRVERDMGEFLPTAKIGRIAGVHELSDNHAPKVDSKMGHFRFSNRVNTPVIAP